MKRRHLSSLVLLGLASLAGGTAMAQKRYDNGASDTEIKLGQTMPLSGPASSFATVGKSMSAWFDKVNADGGVNGRKISLLTLDDGYSPPKAAEQTRRLVEQDGVLAMYGSLGAPTNAAVQRYLNARKVPQLLISSASNRWDDPKDFPWTMALNPSPAVEAAAFVRHVNAARPDAKIGVLYQNDDYGKDYLKGLEAALGADSKRIVSRQSYEVSDPSIDSQIVTLRAAGADVLMSFVTPKFGALSIRKVHELGWAPLHLIANPASTVGQVLVPAGLDRSTGLITAAFTKDPTDPQWEQDAEMKAWKAWMQQYYPSGNPTDYYNVFGYVSAHLMVELLSRSGDELTRENLMRHAASLRAVKLPMLLPGITIDTAPDRFNPVHQVRLTRFDGQKWVLLP